MPQDLGRLDGFLRRCRCRRLGYCEQSHSSIVELFSDIDDTFLIALSLLDKTVVTDATVVLDQVICTRRMTLRFSTRTNQR